MFNNLSFSAFITLRKNYVNKNGECGMYLRIIINRKTKYYSLNKYIAPEMWDDKLGEVKKKHPDQIKLNTVIRAEKDKADNLFLDMQRDKKIITHSSFEAELFKYRTKNNFEIYAKKIIATMTGRYSPETIRQYECEISKLNKFRNNIALNEIDTKFLQDYEYYMRNTLENCTNTVNKTLKKIKLLLKYAKQEDLIATTPFDNYKLHIEPTHRIYLTSEEISKIEELLDKKLNDKLYNVAVAFLFCCYTGLRYQDILAITKENITQTTIDKKKFTFINIRQHKTKESVMIPLCDQAQKILSLRKTQLKSLFVVYSNQKMNDYLKLIAIAADINKNITMHTARHTFATVSLNLGIPLEVVSKLLGHTEIKTTQIYAKMMDQTKFEHMEKWNNL